MPRIASTFGISLFPPFCQISALNDTRYVRRRMVEISFYAKVFWILVISGDPDRIGKWKESFFFNKGGEEKSTGDLNRRYQGKSFFFFHVEFFLQTKPNVRWKYFAGIWLADKNRCAKENCGRGGIAYFSPLHRRLHPGWNPGNPVMHVFRGTFPLFSRSLAPFFSTVRSAPECIAECRFPRGIKSILPRSNCQDNGGGENICEKFRQSCSDEFSQWFLEWPLVVERKRFSRKNWRTTENIFFSRISVVRKNNFIFPTSTTRAEIRVFSAICQWFLVKRFPLVIE